MAVRAGPARGAGYTRRASPLSLSVHRAPRGTPRRQWSRLCSRRSRGRRSRAISIMAMATHMASLRRSYRTARSRRWTRRSSLTASRLRRRTRRAGTSGPSAFSSATGPSALRPIYTPPLRVRARAPRARPFRSRSRTAPLPARISAASGALGGGRRQSACLLAAMLTLPFPQRQGNGQRCLLVPMHHVGVRHGKAQPPAVLSMLVAGRASATSTPTCMS